MSRETLPSDPAPGQDGSKTPPVVAVVYFHGIGNQRRYEETSRLIDAIDAYLTYAYRVLRKPLGFLLEIKPRLETSGVKDGAIVTYIEAAYKNSDQDKNRFSVQSRFYEVYWAPVMAKRSSAWKILTWLLTKVIRPFQMFQGAWRERQRLKRSALMSVYESESKWPKGVRREDFETVSRRYDEFEGHNALRKYPEGTFEQFLKFLSTAKRPSDEDRNRYLKLSRAWRRRYLLAETRNVFVTGTLGLTIGMLGAFTVGAGLLVLERFSKLGGGDYLRTRGFTELAELVQPTLANVVTLVVPLAGLFGVAKFLRDYLGDVEAWTTYEETDAKHQQRREVIRRGSDLLKHVLGRQDVGRVVVVGHSLGTAIAQDCLLNLRRANQAENPDSPMAGPIPLEKLDYFVTLGSPIDKIHYFFESYRSRYHRYKRVVEDLRGDIGNAPFAKDGERHIRWINYWDQADVISGPLHSPASAKQLELRVENVHTANLYYPSPGASHVAYFENQRVIGDLFEIIFRRTLSEPERQGLSCSEHELDNATLGPGETFIVTRVLQSAMLAVPYLVLVTVLLYGLKATTWTYVLSSGLVAAIALAWLLGWLVEQRRGSRNAFKLRAEGPRATTASRRRIAKEKKGS